MAPLFTLFTLLLGACSRTAMASAPASQITTTIKPVTEVSRILNLADLVPQPALQKRDGVECMFPGPEGAAYVGDCNTLCGHFLDNPNEWVHVPPGDIVTWNFRTCQFGVLNRDPCRSNSWQLGRFTSICQSMMAVCVMDGYDGYYHGEVAGFAAALTGDDAAPPYEDRVCW